jgi:hypothetical protein
MSLLLRNETKQNLKSSTDSGHSLNEQDDI